MRRTLYIVVMLLLSVSLLQAQDTTTAKKRIVDNDYMKLHALAQGVFRFSIEDDNFMGGRGFQLPCAILYADGHIDKHFYYRVMFNAAKDPVLLDGYLGYAYSKAFKVQVGAMRPMMSLDFLPNPAVTDFISRTAISGKLVQAREIGLSVLGDIGQWQYYVGIFNGNKLSLSNSNNRFYYMGRLQYALPQVLDGVLKIGANASYGDSTMLTIANGGPHVTGERTIWGADLYWQGKKWFVKGEYMRGDYDTEIVNALGNTEAATDALSGYYGTVGYQFKPKAVCMARWQAWAYEEADDTFNQLSLGMKYFFGKYTSGRINFDAYMPNKDGEDNKYGFSLMLQIDI